MKRHSSSAQEKNGRNRRSAPSTLNKNNNNNKNGNGKVRLLPLSHLRTYKQQLPTRTEFPQIPYVDKINKDDDKFYVGPSDRIGRNMSPAIEGL